MKLNHIPYFKRDILLNIIFSKFYYLTSIRITTTWIKVKCSSIVDSVDLYLYQLYPRHFTIRPINGRHPNFIVKRLTNSLLCHRRKPWHVNAHSFRASNHQPLFICDFNYSARRSRINSIFENIFFM